MIVVDANVVSYWAIHGEKTAQAKAVRKKDDQWILPLITRHEFLNVLGSYIRADRLDAASARRKWLEVEPLFEESEVAVDLTKTLDISAEHKITTYYAEYITLAQDMNAILVTEDDELLKKFPYLAVSMSGYLGAEGFKAVREKHADYRARKGKTADKSGIVNRIKKP